ncbi:hypothetical protein [Sphingomonas sp. S-NIH.Pt15_0812]|uniref:hypothetical protein n=1 Tax=Sphingomonas sp. S-NIH.Pt15_0812 TaxID=1920129 RepID=UPI000F7F4960|nr:hypothetical protein [Sphingomonas sp. S-NIH.Pt15_0812]
MSIPGDLKRRLPKLFLTITADADLVISVCRCRLPSLARLAAADNPRRPIFGFWHVFLRDIFLDRTAQSPAAIEPSQGNLRAQQYNVARRIAPPATPYSRPEMRSPASSRIAQRAAPL